MTEWSRLNYVLNQIKNTSSTNEKKDILAEDLYLLTEFSEDLRIILHITYNPYIRFNVSKVEIDRYLPLKSPKEDYSMQEFLSDLDELVERRITGNDARHWVSYMYMSLPEDFRPWLEKILQKDLKIGCAVGLINAVFPGLIPEFKVPLCQRYKNIKSIKFPVFVEPKIDGVRALAFIDKDGVEIFARSGIRFENFKVIEAELMERAKTQPDLFGHVLDGEIQDDDFQSTMNNARRLHDVDCSNAVFKVWDIVKIEDFLVQIPGSSILIERKADLVNLVGKELPHIKLVNYELVQNMKVMEESYDFWYNVMGEEGVIVKDPNSKYFYKREKSWFKIKKNDMGSTKEEYTATVIEVYQGGAGTKYHRVLGGFHCKLQQEDKNILFSVGSGFTDQQREEFWNRRDELKGKLIDCEAQQISLNKDGRYSLRFPIFIRFRTDL